ncbi:dTDP-4-dehydrorhamnose 3,5-epimerase family protein [Candidatus Poriferisocius sp.]|uniref:dTDP-4-dehydrorhamnose 3,5-epimerase family protein n=1 Tax=Candidatus Poriferisocius sp. TaxID=3101276 RepID=UPI003B026C9F
MTALGGISGVFVVEPDVHGDERGVLVETYRREWFPGGREMVQANRGDRRAGSLVGLHYHLHQADYWYVPAGRARVVLHDLRLGSPTDGGTVALNLGTEPDGTSRHLGVYIPSGVAHGFAALTDMTITYLVDGYYNPTDELGVAWDDPDIAADWGMDNPVLSNRDQANPRRADIPASLRPRFRR